MMDADKATRFIASLTKSLQAVIHGCLDFEKDIELGGYVFLKVDNAERIDYVLNEKMQKSDLNSMTFHSNSFHALPQPTSDSSKPSKDKHDSSAGSTDSAGKSAGSGRTLSRSDSESPMFPTTHSSASSKTLHQNSTPTSARNSDSFMHPRGMSSDEFQISPSSLKLPAASNKSTTVISSDSFRSNNRSLTDFQTAFRNPSASLTSQPHQSSSAHNWSLSQNGSNPRPSSSHTSQHQQSKSGILPDAGDMEVVHIKTEEDDDMFSIPLQCQQGGSESVLSLSPPQADCSFWLRKASYGMELKACRHKPLIDPADGLAVQGKAPWLTMRMRQPFYFPYPRLARSQSFDQRMSMAPSSPRFPFFSGESSTETAPLTCKVCGKSYRSRQGLLFHERAKHQNVFNVYCPICGKGFQQTTHMYGHMATHTNIKNFQCQACGAKYAHKTSLQQHLRSGSCRASQLNSPAGLDLSTSQLLRELNPYNPSETQPRPSTSHSHSQSPLETASSCRGYTEREMTMNEERLSSFSGADQPDSDIDGCEKLDRSSDRTTHLNMAKETSRSNFNLTDEHQVLDQGITGFENQAKGLNILSAHDTRGMIFSNEDESRGLNMTSGEVVRGLNLATGDDTRGSAATRSPSPQALGIDMTKDSQICDNTGSAASECNDSENREEAIYEHDSDVPETVSLSLSADDD